MKKKIKGILLNLLLESFIAIILIALFKIVINSQFKEGNNTAIMIAHFWYSLKYNYPINMSYLLIIIVALLLYFTINKIKIVSRIIEYINKNKYLLKEVFRPIVTFIICFIVSYFLFQIIDQTIWLYCRNFEESVLTDLRRIWYAFDDEYRINLTFISEIIITFIMYYKIYRKRITALLSIISTTKEMAEGNIDINIGESKYEDFSDLSNNINNIVLNLKEMTKKEKESQQTKNDLITNVSHDLRTPLTIILGYLDIIDNDKYEDEVKLRYYVSIAHEKVKELRILTNDLFELTKMQSNDIELKKQKINIVELVGQLISQFNLLLKSNDMVSRINFCDEKLFISGDGEMLSRVFNNIVSNCIKYGRDGKFLDINTYRKDKEAVIDVVNYGQEIPSNELPYIFNRLYRVEKSRSRETGGSGLGLAIAKEIIEMHNGTIEAFSSSEKTVFEVKLNLIK